MHCSLWRQLQATTQTPLRNHAFHIFAFLAWCFHFWISIWGLGQKPLCFCWVLLLRGSGGHLENTLFHSDFSLYFSTPNSPPSPSPHRVHKIAGGFILRLPTTVSHLSHLCWCTWPRTSVSVHKGNVTGESVPSHFRLLRIIIPAGVKGLTLSFLACALISYSNIWSSAHFPSSAELLTTANSRKAGIQIQAVQLWTSIPNNNALLLPFVLDRSSPRNWSWRLG